MKTKILTQEEVRLQISEFLKDCPEETFMQITQICFKCFSPEFEKEKDSRGFRKISMIDAF